MLLAHRLRHHPHRIFLTGDDPSRAFRGLPTHTADADRVRVYDLRLALLVGRVIEDAHGGDVDDDSLMGRGRQHELRRHDDLATDAGQPGIDARIGEQDLLVAHVETSRDVRHRVVLADRDLLHVTHEVAVLGGQFESVSGRRLEDYWRRRRDRRGRRRRRRRRGLKHRAARRAEAQGNEPARARA